MTKTTFSPAITTTIVGASGRQVGYSFALVQRGWSSTGRSFHEQSRRVISRLKIVSELNVRKTRRRRSIISQRNRSRTACTGTIDFSICRFVNAGGACRTEQWPRRMARARVRRKQNVSSTLIPRARVQYRRLRFSTRARAFFVPRHDGAVEYYYSNVVYK